MHSESLEAQPTNQNENVFSHDVAGHLFRHLLGRLDHLVFPHVVFPSEKRRLADLHHPSMKVITGRFGGAKMYVGPQPTHGVYYQYDLAMAGEQAKEVSLHWTFESAVDAAAHEELKGLWPVVVCFEQPANQRDHLTG